ncbi:MAG: hypothetical protein JWO74_4055 [Solirubrobacterales bacterium]|nr:hypothetical protein [Solirubrobacterales bacterium]
MFPHLLSPLAAASPPAGGAEVGQVIGATLAACVLTAALVALGLGHRSGRISVLRRWSTLSTRLSGLPGWAALPSGIATVSLLTAVFGMYWDISLHIDNGRDPGPLANPAHYFILFGLFGIFTAGWFAIVLPQERPGPAAIRIAGDWHVPVSGIMLMACASFALLGFPLDDISHRLFGQDVTLWGPTHLMMLGGAGLSLVGILGLLTEGRAANAAAVAGGSGGARVTGFAASARIRHVRLVSACGGLLIGLSIFQGEFDFGVPQFRLLYQPVLIALAAGIALVAARSLAGRGAALGAVAFYLVVRGGLALLVGPVLGETTPHFPLYIAEALLVEAVALRMNPAAAPFRFAAVAGAAVGSVGVGVEWAWSHVWGWYPWPAHLLGEAIALAVPVAIAGGALGAFAAGALRLRSEVVVTRRAWASAGGSLLVIAVILAFLGSTTVPAGGGATVTLTEAHPAPARTVDATVRFDPPDVARHADWLTTISWQGRGRLVVRRLREVAGGVYRTEAPIPVFGSWKTNIRLHRGNVMASVPVYLPADPAIPAAGVPAASHFRRPFIGDRVLLQRERKRDVPAWLWGTAGAIVLACASALLALLGWGLVRLAAKGDPRRSAPEERPSGARARTAGGTGATGLA